MLISIGYATCHWCHVMAKEAFSNNEIAAFLNEHFVCIKVDREQRPDIDQYFMAFLVEQQGHGGWPLNVICTSDANPFIGLTYVPITPQYGMPVFLDILKYAISASGQKKDHPDKFLIEQHVPPSVEERELVIAYKNNFNAQQGGFSSGPQFPPHNTLLFLLHYSQTVRNESIKEELLAMVEKTLNVMATRGLQDHLQGGFYRYCIDEDWTIPHFEKMLYDQAMLLWGYSAAYKIFEKQEYKIVADKIVKCLEETYQDNDEATGKDRLYYSGHDADTVHEEGATYVWSKKELQEILSPKEFLQFSNLYIISESGNFEGKNHLLKKNLNSLPEIEQKLLNERKKRAQPFVDKKKITSWNALAGIGLLMHWRTTGKKDSKEKAQQLYAALLKKHFIANKLSHSSLGQQLQSQEFLEDNAAVLLLATYLYEEDFSQALKKEVEVFSSLVHSFQKKDKQWRESSNSDFQEVPGKAYDHPTPSSISLATYALARAEFLLGKEESTSSEHISYKPALAYDFFNLATLFSKGKFHMIYAPSPISWSKLSLHSIQAFGKRSQDCYQGKCVDTFF